MQTRERGSGKWLEICFKSTFLTQAKTQMQMCLLTVPLGKVPGSCFWLVTMLVTDLFGKNEIYFFLLFSLYKMADCFH